MHPQVSKWFKILLPLGIGGYLIFYSYYQFTDNERQQIFDHIKEAHYGYIALGLFFALLSHLSRAWRWRYMLDAIQVKPSFTTNVFSIGAAYALNLILPRSGEFTRALIVSKATNTPVEKSFGTIVAERAVDFLILLLIMGAALLLAGKAFAQFLWELILSKLQQMPLSQLSLISLSVAGIILISTWALKKWGFWQKVNQFINGLKEGIWTLKTMEKKGLFALHTIFIWSMYILMFYISIFSLPATSSLSLAAVLCAFVAGSFAVAFTNGGFGAYPFLVAQVLFLFGIPTIDGTALGWLLWLSQTLLVVLYGGISMLGIAFLKK